MSTRRHLDFLFGDCDGGVVELRALPSDPVRRAWAPLGQWHTFGAFITSAVNDGLNVYVGCASRRDRSSGTGANLHQVSCVWVDFDDDPQAAEARLQAFPFPPALLVNSGHGRHAYWKLKEPAALDNSTEFARVASVLRRLCSHLHGDERACDPTRVLRLVGTRSFKYDDPRPVTALHDADTQVDLEVLDDWLPREVVRNNVLVLDTTITEGARNDTLYRLARSLRQKGLSLKVIVQTVEATNAEQCDPPLPNDEVGALLRNVFSQPDRSDFESPVPPVVIHDAAAPVTDVASDGVYVNLHTVAPERVEWLWPGWLPRRKAVVIAGDPGIGKSTLATDISARVSRGGASWPTGEPVQPGRSIFLIAEDGLADTVRPRIDAANGDASQIEILTGVKDASGERLVNLGRDLAVLEYGLKHYRPSLVVIDPITAYLGAVDSYKDAQVRGLLAPLLAKVEEYGCVLLWVAHLTKAEDRKALYRPGGSIAFVAAARVAIVVGEHPEQPGVVVAAQGKNNLAPKAQSLTFRTTDGCLSWGDTCSLTAEQVLGKPQHTDDPELAFTAKGLIRTLRSEPHPDGAIDVRDALARAELVGIPRRTMQHAARQAGLLPFQRSRRWWWFDRSNNGNGSDATDATLRNVAPVASDDVEEGE